MPMDPLPTEDLYPWLPLATVLGWCKVDYVDANAAKIATVEGLRLGVGEWVEDQRRDLRVEGVFNAKHSTRVAAQLAVARLLARQDTPSGLASFEELGGVAILSNDPDIKRMLGRRRLRTG